MICFWFSGVDVGMRILTEKARSVNEPLNARTRCLNGNRISPLIHLLYDCKRFGRITGQEVVFVNRVQATIIWRTKTFCILVQSFQYAFSSFKHYCAVHLLLYEHLAGMSLGALRWSLGPSNRPQGPTNHLLQNAIFKLINVCNFQILQLNGAGPHQSIFPNDTPDACGCLWQQESVSKSQPFITLERNNSMSPFVTKICFKWHTGSGIYEYGKPGGKVPYKSDFVGQLLIEYRRENNIEKRQITTQVNRFAIDLHLQCFAFINLTQIVQIKN